MQELELIKKAQKGDRESFCGLYDLYKDRLFRYAFYRLGNRQDAEDAVSDCFLSAWKQIGNIRRPEAFPSWIFRIISSCCNKAIRKQIESRDAISLDESGEEAIRRDMNTGGDSKNDGSYLVLQEAIEQLSEQERNILILSVICGLNSGEISEIAGITAGSVRSSLSRSLKKVRGYLE